MCTLSYVPNSLQKEGFTVIDNRDESVNRPADFPKVYREYDTQLLYPKDKQAGGTWVGISKRKRMMALMNGAFVHHERRVSYRKSRGIVVKELLASENIQKAFEDYDCEGIEAFFGVVFDWSVGVEIFELIWDGKQKYFRARDANKPQLWSAAMTYSLEQHQYKEEAFKVLLQQQRDKEDIPEKLWEFHHLKEIDGKEGMLIDRGILKTTSITQYRHVEGGEGAFRFKDLLTGKEQETPVRWLPE